MLSLQCSFPQCYALLQLTEEEYMERLDGVAGALRYVSVSQHALMALEAHDKQLIMSA